MAQSLKPCCEATLRDHTRRIERSYITFPVIKDVPCNDCREILKLRVYFPKEDAPPPSSDVKEG